MKSVFASLLACTFVATVSAQTLASIGLYDTGTLLNGANPYVLRTAPAGNYHLYVPDSTAWPINGPWIDNTASTRWLAVYSGNTAPTSGDVPTVAAGSYTIRLTFNLGAYKPSDVRFGFTAAADNTLAVSLNGSALTNLGTPVGDTNYGSLGSYVYSVNGTGLLAGSNYIDFMVTNSAGATGNPAGLFVDFTNLTVVPEPATYALLLGAGTMAVVWVRRRRAA